MDLLVLIALIVIIYLAWMLLKTYRNMEYQLREIQKKCVPATTVEKMSSGPVENKEMVQQVANNVISGLQKMMLAAGGDA